MRREAGFELKSAEKLLTSGIFCYWSTCYVNHFLYLKDLGQGQLQSPSQRLLLTWDKSPTAHLGTQDRPSPHAQLVAGKPGGGI